jgi:hypothetical protein
MHAGRAARQRGRGQREGIATRDVRCWGYSGKHLLAVSISAFDPTATSTALLRCDAQPCSPNDVLECLTRLPSFCHGAAARRVRLTHRRNDRFVSQFSLDRTHGLRHMQ